MSLCPLVILSGSGCSALGPGLPTTHREEGLGSRIKEGQTKALKALTQALSHGGVCVLGGLGLPEASPKRQPRLSILGSGSGDPRTPGKVPPPQGICQGLGLLLQGVGPTQRGRVRT